MDFVDCNIFQGYSVARFLSEKAIAETLLLSPFLYNLTASQKHNMSYYCHDNKTKYGRLSKIIIILKA